MCLNDKAKDKQETICAIFNALLWSFSVCAHVRLTGAGQNYLLGNMHTMFCTEDVLDHQMLGFN